MHVLSSGPPSCHLGVGMSIKVKRWFEVGPNFQSFAQIQDVKRPKIIKDDQTSGRKLYFYVFPHLHSYNFLHMFYFLLFPFCFLPEAADFALKSHCLWGQQSFRPAWFQFVLDHKPKLFARKWDPWKFCTVFSWREVWRAVKSKTDLQCTAKGCYESALETDTDGTYWSTVIQVIHVHNIGAIYCRSVASLLLPCGLQGSRMQKSTSSKSGRWIC